MIIYIDVVFIENIIMNYIIIFSTGLIIKSKIKHLRIAGAATIGAVYTVVAYITRLEIYSNIILKFLLSIIIVYIAFNPQSIKKLFKDVLFFYLTSFLFGGVAFALIYIIKPQDILMKNGLFLGTYPLKTIGISAIIAYIIIVSCFKIIKNRLAKRNDYCKIKVCLNDKIVETTAMIDTGNLLKEPISNDPVVVIEHSILYDVLPKEILNNLEEILGGEFEKIPEEIQAKYRAKLKLIPFSSLGKEHGMLLGIKPKYIEIIKEEDGEVESELKENIIIGIYNKSLTKRGEYRALVGAWKEKNYEKIYKAVKK